MDLLVPSALRWWAGLATIDRLMTTSDWTKKALLIHSHTTARYQKITCVY